MSLHFKNSFSVSVKMENTKENAGNSVFTKWCISYSYVTTIGVTLDNMYAEGNSNIKKFKE